MKKEFNITEWVLNQRLNEETENSDYPPYMYSPVGFSCEVCKFHYIEDEKGHEEWILNDIHHAGGNKENIRQSSPHITTELMVADAYYQIYQEAFPQYLV